MRQELKKAIADDDLETVKHILDIIGKDGNYAIKRASKKGNLDVVEYILSVSPLFDYSLNIVLYYACEKGYLHVIKNFINKKKNKNNIYSTLASACKYGRLDIVEYLFSIRSVYCNKILKIACEYGHLNIVKYFINFFLSFEGKIRKYNNSLVTTAFINNHFDVVKYLLSVGVNGYEALIKACHLGNLEGLNFLISLGVNFRGSNDQPFLVACCHGHIDIAKMLYSLGACIGEHFSFLLEETSRKGHLDVLKFIMSIGPKYKDFYSEAFIVACECGQLDIAKTLYSVGADYKHRSNRAIRMASTNGHLEVKYLVSIGADFRDGCNHSIRLASENNHFEVVKYLMSIGADHTAVNNQVIRSALYNHHFDVIHHMVSTDFKDKELLYDVFDGAVILGEYELVKHLISIGFDIKTIGDTVVKHAIENHHFDIFMYLLSRGININNITNDIFYYAFCAGRLDVVEKLNSMGFDYLKISDFEDLLVNVADNGHLHVLKYLIPYCATEDITSAFYKASLNKELDAVKYLVSIGVNIKKEYLLCYIKENLKHKRYDNAEYLISLKKNLDKTNFDQIEKDFYISRGWRADSCLYKNINIQKVSLDLLIKGKFNILYWIMELNGLVDKDIIKIVSKIKMHRDDFFAKLRNMNNITIITHN